MFTVIHTTYGPSFQENLILDSVRSNINCIFREINNITFELSRASLGIAVRPTEGSGRSASLDELTSYGELAQGLVSVCKNATELNIEIHYSQDDRQVTLHACTFRDRDILFELNCFGKKDDPRIPYQFYYLDHKYHSSR